jgi:hypothetical protein
MKIRDRSEGARQLEARDREESIDALWDPGKLSAFLWWEVPFLHLLGCIILFSHIRTEFSIKKSHST